MSDQKNNISTTIAPWLEIPNAEKAVAFYKEAFGASEVYRLETPDGVVVRLAVSKAEFWISGGGGENEHSPPALGGKIRMILTVNNPYEVFLQALKAGASEIFPVGEDHGWVLGRLEDPFGLNWEIGHQASS